MSKKLVNETEEMKNGDKVVVLMDNEIIIGVFKECAHPYVMLYGKYGLFPRHLVYKYSRERMGDLGIDDDDFIRNVEEILDEKMCFTLFKQVRNT